MNEEVIAEWTRRAQTESEVRDLTGKRSELLRSEDDLVIRERDCCGAIPISFDRGVKRSCDKD